MFPKLCVLLVTVLWRTQLKIMPFQLMNLSHCVWYVDCTRNLTSFGPLPVILYKPKKDGTSFPVFQVCTNGVPFGLIKAKLTIQYFTAASNKQISIWCRFQSAYQQKICKLIADNSFEHTINTPANFATIFTDSKDKEKFTKFLKDVWYYFHNNTAVTDYCMVI